MGELTYVNLTPFAITPETVDSTARRDWNRPYFDPTATWSSARRVSSPPSPRARSSAPSPGTGRTSSGSRSTSSPGSTAWPCA